MNILSTRLLFSIAVILLSAFSVQPVKKDPLPTDLRSEVLLVLLFDEMPIPEDSHGLARKVLGKHNEWVESTNNLYRDACKAYPYPSAMITRSQYHKKEDIPEHRFILKSAMLDAYVNGESMRAGVDAYYVADIELYDRVTSKTHVIFHNRKLDFHKYEGHTALERIVKLLEKGE